MKTLTGHGRNHKSGKTERIAFRARDLTDRLAGDLRAHKIWRPKTLQNLSHELAKYTYPRNLLKPKSVLEIRAYIHMYVQVRREKKRPCVLCMAYIDTV
jgi:hypothetical protein